MQPTLTNERRRRWRRFFITLAALSVVAVVAIWVLPWLLMPDDLRRMQGTWKLVRIEWKKTPNEAVNAEITIVGNRLHQNGEYASWMEIDPAQRTLRVFMPEDNQRTILGLTVDVPLWLSRPPSCSVLAYEFHPKRLVLELRSSMDVATGTETELEERAWRKLYLERE